jgi:hypothetical protein
MATQTDCLYSVVKNTSGSTMKFGFLPPHGWELEDQEERTILGNLVDAVTRGDRGADRNLKALESALSNELLAIKSLPNPLLYDETDDETQMLTVDNGALVVADPCFSVDE